MKLIFVALFFVLAGEATANPLETISFSYLLKQNSQRHRTSSYRLNGLVLRRGDPFDIDIQFDRSYDKTTDRISLLFYFGDNSSIQDGYRLKVPVEIDPQPSDNTRWSATVLRTNGNKLVRVGVNTTTNTPIGVWRFRIVTNLANSDKFSYSDFIDFRFYMIANAWNKYDQVYMDDESLRQEYVLNEMGRIYEGTYYSVRARTWYYGQFDKLVLPTVMYVLGKIDLSISDRADVVKISRAVSAIVNSNDEGGLLVGDWTGKYYGGVAPSSWSDSTTIIRKYVQNGYSPVKFGQCWVFAGLTTTVLRTLGIPARTISNFMSAHDTDASLTVDKFHNNGREVTGVNGDSVWNFHCWSDAWMERRDLPQGYGGWQVIDATPQERSAGRYQLGPASVEAVKQGKVRYAYDVGFVFSEVNANLVRWRPDRSSRLLWRATEVDWHHVGRKILTKRPGMNYFDPVDVVNEYKYRKGTANSRAAYTEAVTTGGLQPIYEAIAPYN